MSFSNHIEDELLDHLLGGNTGGNVYTPPTNTHIALASAADDSTFTECTGTGYARVDKANTTANWAASSSGSKANASAITFAAAGAGDWGTLSHFGIYDAASGGNLLLWGTLSVPITPGNGDQVIFPIGNLVVTLD